MYKKAMGHTYADFQNRSLRVIPPLSAGTNQGQGEGKNMWWILFGDHKRMILRKKTCCKIFTAADP